MKIRRIFVVVLAVLAGMASVSVLPTAAGAKTVVGGSTATTAPLLAPKAPIVTTTTALTPVRAGTMTSARSGAWNNTATWGGPVPTATTPVVIAPTHVVSVTDSTAVAGVTVSAGATLRFEPTSSAVMSSSANVVVNGALSMRPASATISHTLRFVGINEQAMVGGGLVPIASDVGLWVMGAGTLDLAGTPKTAWTRAAGGARAGATSLSLAPAPTGWATGDEVSVVPTEPQSVGERALDGFEVRRLAVGAGALSAPLSWDHPQVNGQWNPEVANLTHNVNIEGTPGGRSHVLIRSTSPQSIRYVGLRWMSPRQAIPGKDGTTPVLGRYALHFHHAGEGSRGSVVEGTVARDLGGHAYAPHASHGITFRSVIAYNTMESAVWWDGSQDTEPSSNDIIITGSLVALVRMSTVDAGAFELKHGDRNVAAGNVAVGVLGAKNAAGYSWPENATSTPWTFDGNISHNTAVGERWWINSGGNHLQTNGLHYNNQTGILVGAYRMGADWNGLTIYGARDQAIQLWAVSHPNQITFRGLTVNDGGQGGALIRSFDHNQAVPLGPPTELRCATPGIGAAPLVLDSAVQADLIDIHDCGIGRARVQILNLEPGSLVRHFTAGVLDWTISA